jgi:hypothetical protein
MTYVHVRVHVVSSRKPMLPALGVYISVGLYLVHVVHFSFVMKHDVFQVVEHL